MPEIPLKISRAIIYKKSKRATPQHFTGQGEGRQCNFGKRALMPKGIKNPEKEELRY